MKNRGEFKLSPQQEIYVQEYRQSHDAHTIMERLRTGIDAPDYAVQFLENATSRGFIIDFNLIPFSYNSAISLMEILKENCRQHGYILYMSDKYEKNGHWVRHYLKPSYKHMMSMPMNQLFGNIQMELRFQEPGRPVQLKVTATTYPGPKYVGNTSLNEFLDMITHL